WTIARALRQAGPAVKSELHMRLESPDYRVRKAAVHLAGWQGPGFLEADLRRMAAEDPDDDVRWECLQALDRQNRERCVLEFMDAFRSADGTARWSYIESILALGDPRLLVTEGDPLWLGPLFTDDLGALEVHTNWRLKERFEEVKRSAERRDRD
ncbi:MAG: HEAT repeat domain-containing protein, partial [Thermoanaerobaculia bacterium]